MAVITVRLPGRKPPELKRRLASGLTEVAAQTLELARSDVTVLIEEFERDNWARGGTLVGDGSAPSDARQDLEAFFRKPAATKPVKAPPKKAAAKSPRRR